MTSTRIRLGGRAIDVSSPDKVLFPADGITKRQLVEYYQRIAAIMVPHLRDRPLMLQRFPNGIGKPGFYQKDISDYFPDWIRRVKVKKAGGTVTHAVCDDAATLVYLADQDCITPHAWLSRTDRLNNPDQLIFDLDPSTRDFATVRSAARMLHDVLGDLGLQAFLKTTGSRGVHVLVPLDRRATFDAAREFARDVAVVIAKRDPEHLTTEARKEKRRGRLLIDVMRNGYAQTAAPAFAVRARPGAPVATPLEWDELGRRNAAAPRYTITTVFRLLDRRPDPWRGLSRHARSLTAARRRLDQLRA